jgi:RHS repeat-associated protein
VLFQTNASGTVTGHATYRGFGRHATSGNLGERGFAGGFELPGLGLTVLGPRVLDADAGRFLSPDPVFNAVNQYAYAQGNPVFLWDPTGNDSNVYSAAGNVAAFAGWVAAVGVAGFPHGLVFGPFFAHTFRVATVHHVHLIWHLFDKGAPTPTFTDFLGSYGSGFSGFTLGPGVHAPGPADSLPPAPPPPSPDCIAGDPCSGLPGGAPLGLDPSTGTIGSLSSLTFSIAISFAGASW